MATKIKPVAKNLYTWSHHQAALLRERRFAELANLIEEVEDLGGALERSVRSRGRIMIEHLLKLQYSPAQDPRLGWRGTIRTQQSELLNDLTPSLHRHPADHLPELYARGRRRATYDLPLHLRSDHRRLAAVAEPGSWTMSPQ